jgi:ATP-dependent 26S proteasome regulatory subunit
MHILPVLTPCPLTPASLRPCQVIAATNRADILDPALMRSGRLDRKIEFPHPTEDARAKIIRIHSRKMNVAPDVNFEELARRCVCVGGGGAEKGRQNEAAGGTQLPFSHACC